MKKGPLKKKRPFWHRHRILTIICLLLVALILFIVGSGVYGSWQTNRRQAKLDPFYDTTGLSLDGALGEVVRYEDLGIEVPGGFGYRILYRTQKADGTNTFSSGMVFSPSTPGDNKPILAWAHGTLGLGDKCAPSRAKDPANLPWISQAMQNNWIVVATDYAGQGTPGVQGYLVGASEAHDVINSVRAARNMPGVNSGNSYAVLGHSQGGNSALFTAAKSSSYAPELELVGTVAAAPAAELVPLMNAQYDNAAGWVIGSIVTASWPSFNSSLNVNDVLTDSGLKNYQKLADQCIVQSALDGKIREAFKQKFFSLNPNDVPAWRAMSEAQSAPDLQPNQPLLVIESKQDNVVLPSTTALYIQQACAAGSNLQSLWIDKGNHMEIPALTTPQIISWIADRFAGQPNTSNCDQPPAVTPASV